MSHSDRPIALMAFANPRRDLANLTEEASGLRNVFHGVDWVEQIVLDHPTLEQILDTFQRHRDRIVLFHYGGHADGFELLLETSEGKTQNVGSGGFSEFLGNQKNLEMVFLNGCATQQQVQGMLDAGVECVVATTREIDDNAATYFSKRFYNGLVNGADLQVAYDEAAAATKSSRSGKTRALFMDDSPKVEQESDVFPWNIYQSQSTTNSWNFRRESLKRRVIAGDSPAETVSLKKLQVLLQKVREFWTDGMLNRALRDGLLEVGKETRPGAINDPWEAVVEFSNDERRVVGADQKIIDIYDDSSQSLLILGQPGSGKTTALLELARDLIDRAEFDLRHGVPVVFHLSAFTNSEEPMLNWLVSELSEKYQIPKKIGENWLREQRLILLLDALDEVPSEARAACINAIHHLIEETGTIGTVVCSRVKEYEAIGIRLNLGGAVCLQPLTRQQILEFISGDDDHGSTLKKILETHPPLFELAQSPLMLNIMNESYQHVTVDELQGAQFETLDGCQNHLFDTYLNRMFAKKSAQSAKFSRNKTCKYLGWLAKHSDMNAGSAIVQLEDIQPSWLETTASKLSFNLILAVVLVILTLIPTYLFWWSCSHFSDNIRSGIDGGLSWCLIPMYLGWFVAIGLVEKWLPDFNRNNDATVIQCCIQGAIKIVVFFSLWIAGALVCKFIAGDDVFRLLLLTGIMGSLLFGYFGRDSECFNEIHAVESFGFSWRVALRATFFSALGGVSIWVIFRMVWEQPNIVSVFQSTNQSIGYLYMLCTLLLFSTVAAILIGGQEPRVVKQKTIINQGMWLSFKNAITIGLQVAAAVGVVSALVFFLQKRDIVEPPRSVFGGVAFSICAALLSGYFAFMWRGGFALVKHVVLRTVLAINDYLPWNTGDLLTHAVKLEFMQQIGGGFIYMHRLLQDHFLKLAHKSLEQNK